MKMMVAKDGSERKLIEDANVCNWGRWAPLNKPYGKIEIPKTRPPSVSYFASKIYTILLLGCSIK